MTTPVEKLPSGWRAVSAKGSSRTHYVGPRGPQWAHPNVASELPSALPSPRRPLPIGDDDEEDPPQPSQYQADYRPWDATSIASEARRQRQHSPSQRMHPKAKKFEMQSVSRESFVDHHLPPPPRAHQWSVINSLPFTETSQYRAQYQNQKPPATTARGTCRMTNSLPPSKPFIASSSYRSAFSLENEERTTNPSVSPRPPTCSREKSLRGHNEVGSLFLQYHSHPDSAPSPRKGKRAAHQGSSELSGTLLSSQSNFSSSYRAEFTPKNKFDDNESPGRMRKKAMEQWMSEYHPLAGHEFSSSYRSSYAAEPGEQGPISGK